MARLTFELSDNEARAFAEFLSSEGPFLFRDRAQDVEQGYERRSAVAALRDAGYEPR
jgi:hypothetical protein